MEQKRTRPTALADYLEVLSRCVFQAGLSSRVVEAKWSGMREAFSDFEPRTVASMAGADVDHLMKERKVIRHRRKTEATITNAKTMLDLSRQYGTFRRYLMSFPNYWQLASDLTSRFRFLGEVGVYQFLWAVREPVPPRDVWSKRRRDSAALRPAVV